MSITEDKKVDIHNLHREDQGMPTLVEKWWSKFQEGKDKVRRKEREMDLLFSDLSNKVRKDPDEYDLKSNPTETAIKSIVNSNEEYCKLYDELLDAKKDRDDAETGTRVIADKRSTIEGEIKLFLSGYYARVTKEEELKEDKVEKGKVSKRRMLTNRKERK